MKHFIFVLVLVFPLFLIAQKKILDHGDLDIWNVIKDKSISPNGAHIVYTLQKGERVNKLVLKSNDGANLLEYTHGLKGVFTYDSNFAIFNIETSKDSIAELKRKKVKKERFPKDTLAVFNISTKELTKLAHLKSYKLPEKWSGYLAYQYEVISKGKDSLNKKKKKVGKENGYHVVLVNLISKAQDTFKYVTNYTFAKKGKYFAYTTSGEDKNMPSTVNVLGLDTSEKLKIYEKDKAKYYQLSLSESGENLAFLVDNDTTKTQIRPCELYHWKQNTEVAQKLLDNNSSPTGYLVSQYGDTRFSKNESKLYFGLSKPPIIKDTTLIDEEIVNVEVWTYDEPRLYTVQEKQLEKDQKKSFTALINLNDNKLVRVGSMEYPSTTLTDEGNAEYALVSNDTPYKLESQWTAIHAKDYALVNTTTGQSKTVIKKLAGNVGLSPKGNYVFGYNLVDSTYFTYDIKKDLYKNLTKERPFYNELNDSPKHPNSYGYAGWTENDESFLIYDRYDIWSFNLKNNTSERLTRGRENKTVYRYVKLDDEERFISSKKEWILKTFNEINKNSGYYNYNPKTKKGNSLVDGPYLYSTPTKAKLTDDVIFTKQSFTEFPDIEFSNLSFKSITKISNANPQQKNYNWGSIELVNWTSLDGKELTGMLVKPEGFDPNKKYPMIVNFYEKSSDRLHRHPTPIAGRSTINYSFYASRGYVIFNPDVYYRVGYPGESAFNCVIPGVTSLIEKGFIDKDNIGVQGHSWGGYQIAYLVTKTNIFKAAEAGAPVPNMISAYGGIRWETGFSRQFQYEHTQSRIGGTPWEYPARYIENSPIFNIDKINTPLLIMHNDKDGHVPWYQGIELFVSLRRLNKPSWFLNYNGEPHWPLKLQNRKDFNIRLAQFFDYYLKGEPKPRWMDKGVPAIEKGINQGYELMKN